MYYTGIYIKREFEIENIDGKNISFWSYNGYTKVSHNKLDLINQQEVKIGMAKTKNKCFNDCMENLKANPFGVKPLYVSPYELKVEAETKS